MKRFGILVLIAVLLLSLMACGTAKQQSDKATTVGGGTTTTKPTETLNEPGTVGPLTKTAFDIFKSGTYHCKKTWQAEGEVLTEEIYSKDGKRALEGDNSDSRYIIKDGYFYTIYDITKTAEKTPLDRATLSGGDETPDFENLAYIASGKALFAGEELDYDEYAYSENSTLFGMHLLYFVKDNVLAGYRVVGEDGGKSDVEYLVFEKEVLDSVFDIPADYTSWPMG